MNLFKVIKKLCLNRETVGYVLEETRTRQLIRVSVADACQLAQDERLVNAQYNKATNNIKGIMTDFRQLPKAQATKNPARYTPNDLEWALYKAKFCSSVSEWWMYVSDKNMDAAKNLKNYCVSIHPVSTMQALELTFKQQGGGLCVTEWKTPDPTPLTQCKPQNPCFHLSDLKLAISHQHVSTVARTQGAVITLYPEYLRMMSELPTYKQCYGLTAILLHEVGHLFSEMYPELQRLIVVNPQNALGKFNKVQGVFYGCFSNFSPEESWADCFMMYHINPNKLKEYPTAYAFVTQIIANIPNYDGVLRMIGQLYYLKAKEVQVLT